MEAFTAPSRLRDNGGRRRLAERRRFASSSFFPERRATRFRRSGSDRRWHPAALIRTEGDKRGAFARAGWSSKGSQ